MRTCIWDGTARDRIHVSYVGGPLRYECGRHDHRGFWELTVVLRGRLEHQLGTTWESQPAGTATLMRDGEAHALRGTAVEYLNLSFDPGFVRRADPAIRSALALPGPFTARISGERLTALAVDAETLAAAVGDHAAPRQAILLLRILTTVADAVLASREAPAGHGPQWLLTLRERLADSLQPIPDLATLRRWAGVAPEHLARSVRLHLGCTPSQWLHQHRLARAARQLAATGDAVQHIAERHGYPDAARFHRCFRAVYGLGPKAYRAREQRYVR
jgi:AraC family cel operon transcriptional repressor